MMKEQEMHTTEVAAPSLMQRCLAEFIGTAFLVFVGAGAVAATGFLLGSRLVATLAAADLIAIALAYGLALTVMIYTIGRISGCHINPAVSIALALTKRMSWGEAGAYILAQLIGGIIGALLIGMAFPGAIHTLSGLGVTNFNELTTNYFVAIVLEALGTFFLFLAIMATAVDRRMPPVVAGIAIGFALVGLVLVLGPVTGASLNPARSIGPALAQLMLGGFYPIAHLIVYIIGPIIGAIVGVYAYDFMVRPSAGARPRETTAVSGD